MKNFVQPGRFITIQKSRVKSGENVLVGSLFGVATLDSLDDGKDSLTIAVEGVFELKKESPKAISLGQIAYFDPDTKLVGPDSSEKKRPIGIFTADAAEDSPTSLVRLTPTCATLEQAGSPSSESEVSGEGSSA